MPDWTQKTTDQLRTARDNALAKLADPAWSARARETLEAVEAEIARRRAEPSGLHPDTARRIRAETAELALADRVARAFTERPPTDTELRVIRAVHDHPDSTSQELSHAIGWAGQTWHLHFGVMCADRAPWLPEPEVSVMRPGEFFYTGILCELHRPENRFRLKPEARTGLVQAGLVPAHD